MEISKTAESDSCPSLLNSELQGHSTGERDGFCAFPEQVRLSDLLAKG